MKRLSTGKRLLILILLVLVVSIALSLISFLPSTALGNQSSTIIDSSFRLTPQETYRQGLGIFHGDENITVLIAENGTIPSNFTLLTYGGTRYNSSASYVNYAFAAGADYYEAVFQTNAATTTDVHFQVTVLEPTVEYPFAWLGTPAKVMFLASWAATLALIIWPMRKKPLSDPEPAENQENAAKLEKKNLQRLKIGIMLSFAFWLILLVLNTYPLATFENWYTDAARHPYSSALFTKVGFSIFNTPLGKLSSFDASTYKFISWAEMPHLYPLGSVFLFMPFSALLEAGASQVMVFKLEIALLLGVSHVCLYLFLKRFWKRELNRSPRQVWGKPLLRQEFNFLWKAFATYLLYIVLVVYAADGQFDAVAFLFCLGALAMFLEERHDYVLLLVAVACTFKYQAGIFLLPVALLSLMQLLQKPKPLSLLKNKAVLAAVAFAAVDAFTALLSSPYLFNVRAQLIMNGLNAFTPHAQISWGLQTFAVLLTLSVTLACSAYLLNRNRIIALFAVFSLLPIFSMPYFQPWYLPVFFVYPLIPQSKRSLQVTLAWLVFMVLILSFGGLSFNPLAILDNIRRILKI